MKQKKVKFKVYFPNEKGFVLYEIAPPLDRLACDILTELSIIYSDPSYLNLILYPKEELT